ncbi:MAG: substrate-binding domain-containing protein [Bacillota bacterium]
MSLIIRPATLVFLIVITLILGGCAEKVGQYPKIKLSSVEAARDGSSGPDQGEKPLKVAIASITSTKESIVYYEELLRYLSKHLDRPVQIVQRKTYAEVNDLVRAGSVDIAFVCTYAYVTGKAEFGMELLVVPQVDGLATYQSYILVCADKEIKTFADLKDKTFAFTDPMSTTGAFYPLLILKKMGETPETFFTSYTYTFSHDNSIRAVAERLVDAAAVDSLVYRYMLERDPGILNHLEILQQSPSFGAPPLVVRPGLEPGLKKQIQEILLEMYRDTYGQKILHNLRIDRFVMVEDKDYDSVRDLARMVTGDAY